MTSWISKNLVSTKPEVLVPFHKLSIRQTPFGIRSAGVCFMVLLSHPLTEIDRTIHTDKVAQEFLPRYRVEWHSIF